MVARVWREERRRSGSGCGWWIGGGALLRVVAVVALAAVLVPCGLPLLAHRALELRRARCQARPGTAAHAGSTTSASSPRRTPPAYSAAIDLHADHGRARHPSATPNGRFTSLPAQTEQESESATRAHQQRHSPRAQPHARTHRWGCTAARVGVCQAGCRQASGRHVHAKLRTSMQQQCACQTHIKHSLCVVLFIGEVDVRRSCRARLCGARIIRLRENYFCGWLALAVTKRP